MLSLMLVFSAACARGEAGLVERAEVTLSASIDPDAFENPGSRIRDWQEFLSKLSFSGHVLMRDLFGANDYFRLSGDIELNGKPTLPFELNYSVDHAWVNSPALGENMLHGSMLNFYEFMLKPYFFMGLRTDLISLLLYPTGAYWVGNAYYTLLTDITAGEGSREVSYDALYELCLTMDDLIFNEDFMRPYRFVRQITLGLRQEESTLYALGDMESWLDMLDSDKQGLKIICEGEKTEYVIGKNTLMTRMHTQSSNEVTLCLPDTEGRELDMRYRLAGNDLFFELTVTRSDGENGLTLRYDAKGLPLDGAKSGRADMKLTFGGAALGIDTELSLPLEWSTDESVTPEKRTYELIYTVPETGKAGARITLTTQLLGDAGENAIDVEAPLGEFDIFGMNSAILDELKSNIKKPLALAMVPFILEMPAGVINDLIRFAYASNILATLGIE